MGKTDGFRFVRGPKFDHMGAWCVVSTPCSISGRNISGTRPPCPSRRLPTNQAGPAGVFLLDENDVADHLARLEDATAGNLRWSETAGLKQAVRGPSLNFDEGDETCFCPTGL